MDSAKNHYSYRVYADPETAQSFDRLRFGSAIGEFIKHTQEQLVFSTLPDVSGWEVIDIGAGTGRLTIPFLEKGARVTACDASEEMLKVLQSKITNSGLQTKFVDAHNLPLPDNSFDCAISFRLLMHVIDWKKALAEFCRVSRDWVIIDLPPRRGFLRFAPFFHWLKKPFAKNLQAYKVLPLKGVEEHLRQQHFQIVSRDDGFFLPIFAHRIVRSTRFTSLSEKLFRRIGLTHLFGSPATIFARRIR
ncbi:class I SAM-dependent methyltransferase [bacterium]|nr:class I SAM-dependent methyltransferase [bacterium]